MLPGEGVRPSSVSVRGPLIVYHLKLYLSAAASSVFLSFPISHSLLMQGHM